MQMQTQTIGSGPTLVLVGGGITGVKSWAPHAERLAKTHTVIRAQPLSVQYGLENRKLPENYSVELESSALDAALPSTPVDIVAWSYGGFIALDFALDHPERIRSLTLIEPPAVWVLTTLNLMDDLAREQNTALRDLFDTMTEDVTPEQLAMFCIGAGFVPPGMSPQQLPVWPDWLEHRRSLRTGRAGWNHVGSRARLEAFPRPVLLVKGTGSSHLFHQIITGLAQALPNAQVLELPGAHAAHVVAMDAFLAKLDAFLASAG